MIAGVSVPFPADVVAAVGPSGGCLRRKKEAEDCPLLGRRIEDFGALDEAQEFELRDDVVTLPLFEPRSRG